MSGRSVRLFCLFSAATCLPGSTARVAAAEDSFVLRAGRVYPVTADVAGPIAPGVVIVRNGKIVAVGDDALALPADLPVLDFPDATVMPGLVSAANELGGRHQGEESVAAGYRAIDAYRPFDRFDAILAAGVTTVHLSPGDHRLVTGQGAVVKLGGPMAGRVLSDRSDLTVNLDASAYDPPEQVEYPIPASADVAIEPSKPQRPASRLGQILAIEEHLDAALSPQADAEFDAHRDALTRAWNEKLPWRVQTERPADIAEAIALLKERGRTGYLVGGAEAVDVAERIDESRLPLVYRVRTSLRAIERDLGSDPDRLDDELANLKRLRGVPLALAGASGEATGDLRLAAARALAAGLDEATVLEAITVVPAQILGVADRVGTLAPGKDADIIVLSGDPLETSSHVLRAYIGGQIAFDAPRPRATVIRAGTIWVDDETRIENGSVLIEDGKITAVGHRVPHPPFAAVIDAGPAGFVTPGFVDAHGHLGLEGDRSALATELDLGWLIGAPDLAERRVARAGVTTTLVAPYRAANGGSQVAAIRTAGDGRADRVVRGTAAVFFDVTDQEAIGAGEQIKKRLDAGKKYLETWLKFEKELAEWKEKIAKGEPVEVKPAAQDVKKTEGQEDPITGTWSVTVSGGPIPEPQTGTLRARLDGDSIEGRLDIPGQPGDVKVVATFDGKHISGYIEIDTGGMGTLTLEADLIETDHIVGTISFQGLSIDLDAVRTDKKAVDFKVVKRRKRGKDGRPLPPEVDQKLEPLRSVLEKKIPLLVAARTAAQIKEVLDTADAFEARVVLLGAEESAVLAERLAEKKVGVIAPTSVLRWEHNRPYHQSDDLSRRKVPVAFQSDREDGARNLPLVAMHAVERGLSADQALAALTCHAARMFQLDDRIGAIREGMDADLVIFTGHPFEAGSRIKRVIAAGKEVR